MAVERFHQDDVARELHEIGIFWATVKGGYKEAQTSYARALERIERSGLDEVSAKVQSARIIRDGAFADARQAAAERSLAPLDKSEEALRSSLKLISLLYDMYPSTRFSPEAWRFLSSEYGATVSMLGRAATLRAVIAPGDNHGRESLDQAAKNYWTAHEEYLKKGSNRYYEASNGVNAARNEVLAGRLSNAAAWLVRASSSAAVAGLADRPNFKNAFATVTARLPGLTSKQAAAASVVARP
ncbi:MAG: hypothetical protein EOT04_03180 [Candidatus Chaera renei]|uniref:Uncharacterized protein n=1 Tax=Candidatus Chaera renei TaxID=2506947 RepID=A0A4Q0AFV4_9BACT|nr:MAG: hypothetical protein EOT04_03180 [Candidatus Chaera renei]